MSEIALAATTRTAVGKQLNSLRSAGKLPAVLYGAGLKSRSIEFSLSEFKKVYDQAGDSTLIDLKIDNEKPVKALIHDYQVDPVISGFVHVDLYQVNMNEKLKAELVLHFIGEAPAVKEFGGVMVKNLSKVHIECLPGDLIGHLDVDLSVLKTLSDSIHVRDLTVPKGITIKNDPNELIARVTQIKEEVPEVAAAAAVSAADIPVVEKKEKAEGEAEGEEKPKAEAKK